MESRGQLALSVSQQLWEPSMLREQLVLWGRVAVWGLLVLPETLWWLVQLAAPAEPREPGAPGESKQSVQPELVPLPEAPGEPELLRPLEEWGELSDRTTQPGRHHCCQR